MKTLSIYCCFAVISVLSLTNTKSSSPEINAAELAYHLDYSTWVSQFRLNGKQRLAQICLLKNGQIGAPILSAPAFPTDSEFTRIAIIASSVKNGTSLSLQIVASPLVRTTIPSTKLPVVIPLPAILESGDYVLGGVINDALLKNVRDGRDLKPTDCKEGLLLRVK